MKIAYIAAGAGRMYCGSCLRDNTLARALSALGHPTVLVPTYTPLRTEEESASVSRVFYGGIGVYLAERFASLRRPIPFLDRALAAPWLLKAVSRLALATGPASLGDLTVSVLKGEEGHQKKALEELVDYLEWEVRPDLVHLTNSLLVGLAARIKRRLRVPVVSSFQGEDLFLEGLPEPHRRMAVDIIRRAAGEIDAFVAVSAYSRNRMADYLGVPRERIRVAPPGIRLDGYPKPGDRRPVSGRPFTIGYLARIAPEKGLAVLSDAYRILLESLPRGDDGDSRVLLRAAGYLGRAERPYLDGVRRRLREGGFQNGFEYVGEVDRARKIEFLRGIDVLSVPATYPEAMGLYAYEAMAAGVPLVLPRSGAFPEIIEATGGGILVEPEDPTALANGLGLLLGEPKLREELGSRGAHAVHTRFHAEAMARATLEVYQSLLSEGKS